MLSGLQVGYSIIQSVYDDLGELIMQHHSLIGDIIIQCAMQYGRRHRSSPVIAHKHTAPCAFVTDKIFLKHK